jgi:uncharacterized protein YjiS (DUF1127 family)
MAFEPKIDFGRIDYPALTPRERDRLKCWAIQRAHDERTEALRRGLGRLATLLWRLPGATLQAYLLCRRRRRGVAELRAQNDRTLADIGIARCEIDAVAFGRRRDVAQNPQ